MGILVADPRPESGLRWPLLPRWILPVIAFVALAAVLLFVPPTNARRSDLPVVSSLPVETDQLLRATVRLRVASWQVADGDRGYKIKATTGNATVKDGRYLVTHNHFDLPLTGPGAEQGTVFITVLDEAGESLYRTSNYEVVLEDQETLVIDLAPKTGERVLAGLGRDSAEFAAYASQLPPAGATVYRVNWDGEATWFDTTTVERIDTRGQVVQLILADPILVGASGGGIFYQGRHVATNWMTRTYYNSRNEVVGGGSTAVVNSLAVVEKR